MRLYSKYTHIIQEEKGLRNNLKNKDNKKLVKRKNSKLINEIKIKEIKEYVQQKKKEKSF